MSYRLFQVTFASITIFMLSSAASAQATWYVDETAPSGGNGQSWETAFDNPQDALQHGSLLAGDQIWVAKGCYAPDEGGNVPSDPADATFLLIDGVKMYGGFLSGDALADRDPVGNETILTGDLVSSVIGRQTHCTCRLERHQCYAPRRLHH